jgi:hypothetical protein
MSRLTRVAAGMMIVLMACGFTECYRPVGRSGDGAGGWLPGHIRTIGVPPFQNPSLRFKVEQRFTGAVIDEILRRSRSFNVISTEEGADAVMRGTIRSFNLRPTLLDDFGRARLFEVTVTIGLTIRDQTRNKVIYDNPNYIFRSEYEISGDPQTFFTEEGPAVERLARDFARSLMTTLLEGF